VQVTSQNDDGGGGLDGTDGLDSSLPFGFQDVGLALDTETNVADEDVEVSFFVL
jgi:hypothetical protein